MTRYTPLWLQAGNYPALWDRSVIGALWPTARSSGAAVSSPGTSMNVNVAPGQVAAPTANGTGSVLCTWDAIEVVGPLTPAPGSGINRIDLIIVRPRGNDLDGGSNNDFILDFVTGAPLASPAVPATPAGCVALAQILIPGGSAVISTGNITDVRPGNLAVPTPASTPHYACSYQRGAGWTMPATAGQYMQMMYDNRFHDDYGCYNQSTGTYTCPVAGLYFFAATIGFNSVSGFYTWSTALYKNGTMVRRLITSSPGTAAAGGYNEEVPLVSVEKAAAGDQYQIWMNHSTANAISARGAQETAFSAYYIGPT